MSLKNITFFLTFMLNACVSAESPDQGPPEQGDAITLLRQAESDQSAIKSAIIDKVRELLTPQLAPGNAAGAVETAVVVTLEKTREKVSSKDVNHPRSGDQGEITYNFTYQETSPTLQVFAEGTVTAPFRYDGKAFALDEDKGISTAVLRYGVTDVIRGNVQDCELDTATPLVARDAPIYQATITITFRDGHVKHIFTDSSGNYVIRAVKGEEITVVASAPGYDSQNVNTFVPDEVNFSLCPTVVNLPTEISIEGFVTYANGVSAAGALVQAFAGEIPVSGSSVANSSGAYRLLSVPVTATSVKATVGTKAASVAVSPNGVNLTAINIVLPNSQPTCSISIYGTTGSSFRTNETLVLLVTSADGDGDSVAVNFSTDGGEIFAISAGRRAWKLPSASGQYTITATVSDGIAPATCERTVDAYLPAFKTLKVVGGIEHTCALLDDASLKCWGSNAWGQLGVSGITKSSTPIDVTAVTGVVDVEAGGYHTCAILTGGVAKCWGRNDYGQLGDGTKISRNTPKPIVGLHGTPVQIQHGTYFTCVRLDSGAVDCFGLRNFAQIGDGSFGSVAYTSPVSVVSSTGGYLTGVDWLEAGGQHACVLNGEALTCWGNNHSGQLGLGIHTGPQVCSANNPCATSATPSLVSSGIDDLMIGQYSTCTLMTDQTLRCFGYNDTHSELGIGDQAEVCMFFDCNPSVQQSVKLDASTTLSGITAIASGMSSSEHFCVNAQGSVYCWGRNHVGQNGDFTYDPSAYAVEVTAASPGLGKLTMGFYHTCGVTTGGAVECWGFNINGELGNGESGNKLPWPVRTLGF